MRVQKSRITHREIASIGSATYSVQKSGAKIRFPPIAEIQTETPPAIRRKPAPFRPPAPRSPLRPQSARSECGSRPGEKIIAALEKAGVEFLDGGGGVRLKPPKTKRKPK
jgi:hypothetical protein